MKDHLTLITIVSLLVLAMAVTVILTGLKKPVYRKRGQLLLLNEQRFMTALIQALPADLLIGFKVRLLDIVSVSDARSGRSLERELAQYCVDFVLIDRMTSEVRLCIEMDMESRNASERIARNTYISRALRRAEIRHLRLPLLRFYDPARLRVLIRDAMGSPAPAQTAIKPHLRDARVPA